MTKDEALASASDDEEVANKSSKRKAAIEEIEVDVSAPEPPSKRAKRALKKGKSITAKASSDDGKDDDETNGKTGKTRAEHSVWIGNLAFNLTAKELRQWLIDNSGEVIKDEAITRIKLPTVKSPGKPKEEKPANKGFAYVDFADIGSKVAAIALSETDFRGRRLLIKDSTSYEGRPAKEKKEDADAAIGPDGKPSSGVEANASRKVFVGNLSFKVTEDDIWHNFEKCGAIESVKLATFEDTGKCKGFGWVKFKEAEGAAWAVKGFVKVKEAIDTEEDFQDKSDDDEEEEEDSKKDDDSDTKSSKNPLKKKKQQKPPQQQKQFKTRKWWVNRLLGRELKLELAEDDQSRYKKRFGKDRPRNDGGDSRGPRPPHNRRQEANGDDAITDAKPIKTATDINVARLKGQVVEHTGTKTSFD